MGIHSGKTKPKVFISYSNDSRAHRERVLTLAQTLRKHGVDAELDQFHNEEIVDWIRWCRQQVKPENSDFVLCICTAEYQRRIDGLASPEEGQGSYWEGSLLYTEVFNAKGNLRIIPVLLGDERETVVLDFLRGWTRCRIHDFDVEDSGFELLLRILHKRAKVEKDPIGQVPDLPTQEATAGKVARAISEGREYAGEWGDRPQLLTVHQLPVSPANFTGREKELAELELDLDSAVSTGSASSGVRVAIQGMGGLGKTALAVVLAHRMKARYPGDQLYLDLRGADPEQRAPLTPEVAMETIVHAVNPMVKPADSMEELGKIYRSELAKRDGVLVLLDNVASAEQVKPLLPPNNCLLLLTSRARFSFPGFVTRRLKLLVPEKSQELLLKLAHRLEGSETEAAELCGHLPLALEVFAGVVNENMLYSVSDLLDRLRAQKGKLKPVESAFEVSYQLLEKAEQKQWIVLSVFSGSFDMDALAAVWDLTEEEARVSMQGLVGASLVEWDQKTDGFRLHDLVREYCRGKLRVEVEKTSRMRHARHYQGISFRAKMLYSAGGESMLSGLGLFDRELENIEAAFGWLKGQENRPSAELLIRLVDAVVEVATLRFHPRRWIDWLEVQLMAARFTRNRAAEGAALGNLGLATSDLGEMDRAIAYCNQHLEIARELKDRRGEGNALCNIGLAHCESGDYCKAVQYLEQDLEIAREIKDRRGEGAALGNLGLAHFGLKNMPEAKLCFEQHLEISRDVQDRRGEGNALGNLGRVYHALWDYPKAIELYEKALVIQEALVDPRGKANTLFNSSLALNELKNRKRAIRCAGEALQILDDLEDPNAAGVRAVLESWEDDS